LAAAYDIINWNDIHIELEEGCPLQTGSIMASLTEVLLGAFRLKDERAKEAPGEDLTIEIDESPEWGTPLEGGSVPKDVTVLEEPLPAPSPEHAVRLETSDTIVIKVPTEQGFKEVYMNIPKLNKAVELLKENLGGALLATDIFSSEDGQSLVGFNSQPAACAVFSQITKYLNNALIDSKFPEIGRYYLVDLVDRKMILVIPMGDFIWSMLIDGSKTQLGMLLNLAIPKAVGAFEEALAE
jgi:hypothetical protein